MYGANYYNAFVGWFGAFLFVGALVAWIVLYVYVALFKKSVQKVYSLLYFSCRYFR